MSRNYKFHNPEGVYFVSFAVVEWLDVFTRNEYKDIVLDCLRFCQKTCAGRIGGIASSQSGDGDYLKGHTDNDA